MNDEMQYANINGFRMRYRVRGSGHPIVIVTGALGSIEQEDGMAGERARLVERYMVIHHDSRGRGESSYGNLDYRYYTWEAQAADMVALLDHLNIKSAHFIGGSQGAAAIIAMAIRYPERVSALVCVNPPEIRELTPKYMSGMMEYADFIEQKGMEATIDLIMSLPPNDTLKKTHPELINMYERIMRVQDAKVIAAAMRGTVQYEPITADDLRKIKCPMLVFSQKGDGLHPMDIAQFIADNTHNCELFISPNMTFYNDNPTESPRRTMAFLSRIDGTVWE